MDREKLIDDINSYLNEIEKGNKLEYGNFMLLSIVHKVNDPGMGSALMMTAEDAELKTLTARVTNGVMCSPGGFIGDLPSSLRILVINAVNRYTMGLASDQQKKEDFPVHAGGIIQLS